MIIPMNMVMMPEILAEILESNYFTYPDTDMIKINHLEHIFHDIVVTKLHVHSDHDKCLVIIPVNGQGRRIQEFYTIISKLKSVISHQIVLND
jgi:metal-responsive CopG/Arc/MetJ family transcriptional regulator